MDYEKKYKDALARAKEKRDEYKRLDGEGSFVPSDIEYIFPELKESEDERIRKDIIETIKIEAKEFPSSVIASKAELWLVWLEKQGDKSDYNPYKATIESISAMIEKYAPFDSNLQDFYDNVKVKCKDAMEYDKVWLKKQGEQTSAEIKSKFKVGDWITNGEHIWKVTAIYPSYCILQSPNGDMVDDTISHVNQHFHLWTIQDAKDGDVLKEDSCMFIIEKMKHEGMAIVYCCLFDDGDFDLIGSTLCFDADSTCPATKEQRDLLFQKMREVGYERDV